MKILYIALVPVFERGKILIILGDRTVKLRTTQIIFIAKSKFDRLFKSSDTFGRKKM